MNKLIVIRTEDKKFSGKVTVQDKKRGAACNNDKIHSSDNSEKKDQKNDANDDNIDEGVDYEEDDDEQEDEDEFSVTEEEPGDLDESFMEEQQTDSELDTEDEDEIETTRVYNKDSSIRTEPKFLVFLSHLLSLFKFCHFCKEADLLLETKQVGTMAIVTALCSNPNCRKEFVWKSQPLFPETKIPAGNMLLSFAILVAGGSASKVFQIFRHMEMACISLNTFFKHQRQILFPSILLHWQYYQQNILDKAKACKSLVVAGDGRHDSMGHSAKYCGYSIFGCDLSKIIHFELVQRNQAGSSTGMEYMVFQKCFEYLLDRKITISTFISDRHLSIAKHMREKMPNIIHYFDLWHLKKSVVKSLTKIAKETACESLTPWIKPCGNHLYWSACSTHDGNGDLIWAKFKTFQYHIINKHEKFENQLFNKCNHGPDIPHRQWMLEDSTVYDKLCKVLNKPRIVAAIKKASPIAQTSYLEGFHSVLNQFAPKMISYSFMGMYCRHVLAILYFNSNLHREVKLQKDGTQQVKVRFPKFKNGEGTVQNVRVKPNLDYVEEVFQTVAIALKENTLEQAQKQLKEMTPSHMNTMLNKESKESAIKKKEQRSRLSTKNVPPTTPVAEIPAILPQRKVKSKPHCSACKKPMKGHKRPLCEKKKASR